MTRLRSHLSVFGGTLIVAIFVSLPSDAFAQHDVLVEGKGVKVGEGTVLRPIVGLETGYVSNLFYESVNPTQVALVRVIGEIAAKSAGKERTKTEAALGEEEEVSQGAPPALEWKGGLRLKYEEFPFSNHPAPLQRNLEVDAEIKVVVKPKGTFRFEFDDLFARAVFTPNFGTRSQITRDVNELKAGLVYQPGGRAITAGLHYENRIDFFEDGPDINASRVAHKAVLAAGWQWLPITKFTFEATAGLTGPLGTSTWKKQSIPFTGRLGVATAITQKTFGRASFGWAYAGYNAGPGYNTPVGDVEFGYRYSPTGRFTISYSYDHADSINANYYRDHAILFKLDQQLNRLVLDGVVDVRLRGYQGIETGIIMGPAAREDFMIGFSARGRYLYKEWLSFDAHWRTKIVQTDYRYSATLSPNTDPSFIRHEIMLGGRAAF